jgi:hypothetical protein
MIRPSVSELSGVERASVEAAAEEASVSAFHVGMGIAGR